MKYFFATIVFFIFSFCLSAQEKKFIVNQIPLPPELSYYDNQFSGLQVTNEKLYLLSECRLQDNREAKLYSIKLTDIEQLFKDSTFVLPYEKIMIYGLDSLAIQMKKQGQVYEGLEAFIIDNSNIYFSVETNTPSAYCYLLKGKIENNRVNLQQSLTPLRKPHKPNGESIYNAGFEAMMFIGKNLFTFYEYNYFDKNYAYHYNQFLKAKSRDSLPVDKLPFRITDITSVGNNHFTAINLFYKGEAGDEVYRVPATDSLNNFLTKTGDVYHNYCRLIDIDFSNKHFSWKPIWTFPKEYTGHNWEGIAAYSNGYFVLNDKYTPARPYASVLLYLHE